MQSAASAAAVSAWTTTTSDSAIAATGPSTSDAMIHRCPTSETRRTSGSALSASQRLPSSANCAWESVSSFGQLSQPTRRHGPPACSALTSTPWKMGTPTGCSSSTRVHARETGSARETLSHGPKAPPSPVSGMRAASLRCGSRKRRGRSPSAARAPARPSRPCRPAAPSRRNVQAPQRGAPSAVAHVSANGTPRQTKRSKTTHRKWTRCASSSKLHVNGSGGSRGKLMRRRPWLRQLRRRRVMYA
mmetsp:Transcript_78285/g.221347  ORF Transcript_78285/g.221347 Transcript_78285/m.221347 type:complete len:246 (-) Transcript_78285:62-799(-)